MNKALLIGNIANDLELRKTQTGKSVVSFSVAVNEGYGEKKTTEYIDITAWENIAENVVKYCHKGSKIFVEGKNKSETYEKDGMKRKLKYVLATNVEFLDSKDTHREPQDTRKVFSTEPRWDMNSATSVAKEEIQFEQEALPFY